MFCSDCGKEIPDSSVQCPECGKKFVEEVVPAVEKTETPKSSADVNVGAFLSEFFKNPIDAIMNRSADSYWLWGLISLGAFAIVYFLRFAFDDEVGGGSGFALMFALLCGMAGLIFSFFLLQSAFKLEKKSLPSIVAVVGLSMIPAVPVIVIASIFDFLFLSDISFMSIFLMPMIGFVYLFSGIILSFFYLEKDESGYMKSTMLVVTSFAISVFITSLFGAFVWNNLFL